jgi:hypothetical protein
MSKSYQTYFETETKKAFKEFLVQNKGLPIYTDHFTKYGIDLVRGNNQNSISITNSDRIDSENNISSVLVINNENIQELEWQGYEFPLFNRINMDSIKTIHSFGKFRIYSLKDIHPVK